MTEKGRITLYLCFPGDSIYTRRPAKGIHESATLQNWPGTLSFPCKVKVGRHNIAGRRYDAWFRDHAGSLWHGVQYGDNTQLCHCKRLKAR